MPGTSHAFFDADAALSNNAPGPPCKNMLDSLPQALLGMIIHELDFRDRVCSPPFCCSTHVSEHSMPSWH